MLMTRCNANAVARFGIDAEYVVKGASNRLKLTKGRHGDLWDIFFIVLDMRSAETGFFKVASHIEDVGAQAVHENFAHVCDIIGNALADAAADLAAAGPAACVPL